MTTKVMRKIVKIDEEKCNGCGECVPSCVEGALKIIDGKARLVSETYCDGLGACLGKCPQDAITVEEREAEEFDEVAVEQYQHSQHIAKQELPCGCPGTAVREFTRVETETAPAPALKSTLNNWPVQLRLVPPSAPFLTGADILLAADCAPFAYASFHQDFLKRRALIIACPKLDNFEAHLAKMTDILRVATPKSLTVVHMEVPCCFGLVQMAKQAIQSSGKNIPLRKSPSGCGVKGSLSLTCR